MITIRINSEAPPPTLAINPFETGINFQGETVYVLASACDVWIGSDRVASWRDAIPSWRRVSALRGSSVTLLVPLRSYVTAPSGVFSAPSPVGGAGVYNPNFAVPPTNEEPDEIKDGYVKLGSRNYSGPPGFFNPRLLWYPEGWSYPTGAFITQSPASIGPVQDLPGRLVSGPVTPDVVWSSGHAFPITSSNPLYFNRAAAMSWSGIGMGRTGVALGLTVPIFLGHTINGTPWSAGGYMSYVFFRGVQSIVPTNMFSLGQNNVAANVTDVRGVFVLTLGVYSAANSINTALRLEMEVYLPNFGLTGAENAWGVTCMFERNAATPLTAAGNLAVGYARPNCPPVVDGMAGSRVFVTPAG